MTCERGRLQVAITLAPTMPPTVQFLTVRPAPAQPQRASHLHVLLTGHAQRGAGSPTALFKQDTPAGLFRIRCTVSTMPPSVGSR